MSRENLSLLSLGICDATGVVIGEQCAFARFQVGNRRLPLCWGLVMKKSLKFFLTVAAETIVFVISSEPMFARGGGAANIMNSPGLSAAASGIQAAGVTTRRAAVCDPIDANGDVSVSTEVL